MKDGLKYSDVIYSHSGINQMWILKNSKELFDNLQSHSLTSIHSIPVYNTCTFLSNNIKYIDANLYAPDNAISDNESPSEMLTSQSQISEWAKNR